MIDACIADGDMVLMEPVKDFQIIKNGTIVSAMVPGLGTTLKYFVKKGGQIFLKRPIVHMNLLLSMLIKFLFKEDYLVFGGKFKKYKFLSMIDI